MIEIRGFQCGDGPGLVRLLHAAYGYTYISDSACRYQPEGLEAHCLSPANVSVVARDAATGRIVGHIAWEGCSSGQGEGTMFAIDPNFPAPHLGTTLLEPSVELARARGARWITTHSPTHHDRSQRMARFGVEMRPTGLLLGSYPETLCFRGISPAVLSQRESFLYMARPLEEPRPVAAPVIAPHQAFIESLLTRLGLTPRWTGPASAAAGAGPSLVSSRVNPYWLAGAIAFARIGADARERLEERLCDLRDGCLRHIELSLPLSDPGTPGLSAHAEALGFFPAGLWPRPDGLHWGLQFLQHQRIDPAAIQLLDQEADELRAYIAERMPAEVRRRAPPRELLNAGALELDLESLQPHIDQATRRARRHGRQAALLRLSVPEPGGAEHRRRRALRRRLEELAGELGTALRATDLKAQIDGQSILVLLPEVLPGSLPAVCERIQGRPGLHWKEGRVDIAVEELNPA